MPRFATSRRRRRLVWGVAVLLLAGLIGVTAAALVRISSPRGDYVIQTDDPDFSFRVNPEGGVTLTDRRTRREFVLRVVRQGEGEFELEASDAAADLAFKSRTFTIRRGQTIALRAWFERRPLAAAPRADTADEDRRKAIAALPAEKQVEAVATWLKERNPGFDGRVTSQIEDGVVTELRFLTHQVTDLAPVRALPDLQTLFCTGTPQKKGWLADQSPLGGTRLSTLYCGYTDVSDLSPLKGTELTDLRCTAVLRSIRTLKKINGKEAAEYWKEVDGGKP
jgi:hypothetical protein